MAKKPAAPKFTADQVKAMRLKSGLTQYDWWSPFGVSQSGGSRYESGRGMAKSIHLLIAIRHGTEAQRQAVLAELMPG